jgi:putative peptidoglycan lipid II flippase
MPWLTKIIAPGFDMGQHQTLVMLSRIMLAQPIIIGISNMVSSVTQMFRKFFITALAPVFYNVGIIIGVVAFYPMFGITGLAYGVLLGALLHLGIQIPVLVHHKMIPAFSLAISWTELRSVVITSVPRTIGLSMNSLTALILTSIASLLGVGAISIFSLTNNMLNVPIGIIGISYAVASFPTLVKFFNNNERGKFAEHIVNATRKIIFWSVPMTVLFIVLRAQIVRVILGSKSFSWNDTRLAAACLALFVIGLVAQSLVHLFVRGYYAVGNTKKPLITNFIGQITTILLAGLFLWLMRNSDGVASTLRELLRLEGVPVIDLLALPFAFAIGNILNSLALWRLFIKDFPETNTYPVIRTSVQTITASLCMGAVTYGALNIFAFIFNQDTFWGIFAQGLFSAFFGITIFMTVLLMVKNQEMIEFMTTLKRKFWKADVVQDMIEVDK